MANSNSENKTADVSSGIRVLQGIPADLMAMSREAVVARLAPLHKENPELRVYECGRTDPYVSDNDLRTRVEDAEWCLGIRE